MIRTVIWWIYFVGYLIFTLPSLLYVKYLDKKGKNEIRDAIAVDTAARWGRNLVRISGSEIVIKGEENIPRDKPAVFIGNHQGNFDIPILLGYVNKPMGFIAKIEMTKIPVIRAWMKYLHCVFMDREDIRQSVVAINEGVENIKNGHSIIIFPEGTRSKGVTLGEFKAGSFKLATKSGYAIVPVTMNGSYRIFEANKSRVSPAEVTVTFSAPIETKDLSPLELKGLPEKVKNIINENLAK